MDFLIMFLNPKERLLFASWCKQQSNSCKEVADQIDKLNMGPIDGVLSKRERQKSTAFAIVAMELLAEREEVEIKPEFKTEIMGEFKE